MKLLYKTYFKISISKLTFIQLDYSVYRKSRISIRRKAEKCFDIQVHKYLISLVTLPF